MPMPESFVGVDTPRLIELAEEAKKAGYNRTFSPAFIRKIDPDGAHVVAHTMLHGAQDDHVRAIMLVKFIDRAVPTHATLDIKLSTYLTLPKFGYDDEGNLVDATTNEIVVQQDRASLKDD